MNKIKLKKMILVICMIVALLAPNVCLAIEPMTNSENSQEVQQENNEGQTENKTVVDEEDKKEDDNDNDNVLEDERLNETSEEETPTPETTEIPVTPNEEETSESTPQVMSINQENQIAPISNEDIKTVEPGIETLQDAIANAKPGSIIQLKSGYYRGSNIVIDKDITIRGVGNSGSGASYIIPKIILKDSDDTVNNVCLENFATQNQPPENGFIYIDIQKTVNLTMNNVMIFHILRELSGIDETQSVAINMGSETSGSEININNSIVSTTYEGIVTNSSSNNVININNTRFAGRIAFKLEKGTGNKINITNNSTVTGRSAYSVEDEAISIIDQHDLKINVVNSKVEGADAKGNQPTHLFSFDKQKTSDNVKISITGNSEIDDKYGATGSSLFNFGESNTSDNSNSVYIGKDVKLNPNTVDKKYNTDNDYAMVGIFDKDGNLTVKAYDKNKKIDEIKGLAETLLGCTWEKKIDGDTTPFDIESYVTENMDLYPIMPVTVKVNVDGEIYEVKEGSTFEELYGQNPQLKTKIDDMKAKDGFKRFVDQDGNEVKDTTAFLKDTTITPKYEVKVTVVVGSQRDEYVLEEGQLFGNIEEKSKYENESKKRFVKYVDVNDEEIKNETPITKDIEVKPIYEVDVTIGEEVYTLQEGQKLNDLSNEEKQKIDTAVNVKKKHFTQHFTDTEGKDISYETEITEHKTLTPKYNVKVTIEKFGGETKELDEMPEGSSIKEHFGDSKVTEIEQFVHVEGKTFDKFENDEGKPVDFETKINEDTKFLAVYEDKITITIKGVSEDKQYVVETGENLNSLGKEKVKEIEDAVKVEGKSLSHFVDDDGNEVDFTTSLQKTTTLNPKYKVTVTVKPKYDEEKSFDMPEGSELNTLNDDLKQFEEKGNKKTFIKYTDETGENDISKSNKYDKNVTIVPNYEITITVKSNEGAPTVITAAEGSKIEDIANELVNFESESVTNKVFVNYVDKNGKEVARDKELVENITIVPKYNIKVTVERADGSSKGYTIPEGAVLNRLSAEEMNELNTFVEDPNKVFDSFKDEYDNEVDFYTELSVNTKLTPKYNVTITINGEVVLTIEEGKKLSELTLGEKSKLDAAVNKDNKNFAGFEEIDNDTAINTNITLTPKYTVDVVIGSETYTVDEGTSLTQLKVLHPEVEEMLESLKQPDKNFIEFEDESGNVVDDNTVFNVNTKIVAKHTVNVEVEKPGSENETDDVDTQNSVDTANPNTSDNIINAILLAIIGLLSMIVSVKIFKKYNK